MKSNSIRKKQATVFLIVLLVLGSILLLILHRNQSNQANENTNDSNMLWTGLAASSLLCMSVTSAIVLLRYSRSMFPLLLPREHDSHIHIYAFDITPDNISLMSKTAGNTLQKEGFSTRLQILTGICIEDMLNLVIERNRDTTNLCLRSVLLLQKTQE